MDKRSEIPSRASCEGYPTIMLGQTVWTNFRLLDTQLIETQEPCQCYVAFICLGIDYSYCMIEFPDTGCMYPVFFRGYREQDVSFSG